MKPTILAVALVFLPVFTQAQNVLTRKEIYRINCKAVVQIQTEEGFGVGFVVSPDGLIMTANHVVTTKTSDFRQYASDIKIALFGRPTPYPATPIATTVSDDQANYDSAIVKIRARGLPHVTLGDWATVNVGDPLTILPSFPGFGCILLEGSVAAKGPAQTYMGPKSVNTIIFQSPVRNGFSGSPIFDSRGLVIGIEDTKVFGISPALDQERGQWKAAGNAGLSIDGTSLNQTLVDLTNNLDQNLISGLGSGVAINYAKEQQKSTPAKP